MTKRGFFPVLRRFHHGRTGRGLFGLREERSGKAPSREPSKFSSGASYLLYEN